MIGLHATKGSVNGHEDPLLLSMLGQPSRACTTTDLQRRILPERTVAWVGSKHSVSSI